MKILDYINENSDKTIDIYFDMDGVLADFNKGVKQLCPNNIKNH